MFLAIRWYRTVFFDCLFRVSLRVDFCWIIIRMSVRRRKESEIIELLFTNRRIDEVQEYL